MERALPRPLTIPWRTIGWALYVGVNVGLIIFFIDLRPAGLDWELWSALPEKMARGEHYVWDEVLPFVWSPVAAWGMVGVVEFLGYWPWLLLHIAAVVLLRDVKLIFLILVSWAFWTDAAGANTLTFSVVAGVMALRGSRNASLVYLALLLLMPRPVQMPLAAWILWRDYTLWRPFAVIFVLHAGIVLASGYAGDWVRAMLTYGSAIPHNIGPSAFVGHWWLLVGLPLAAWLTLRGRVGWAGLAMSVYVLPQYLMMPLVEIRRRDLATSE